MSNDKEPTYSESAARLQRILEALDRLARNTEIPTKQPPEERWREERGVREQ